MKPQKPFREDGRNFTVAVVFAGDGGPTSLRQGEEHWRVQLQHPAAGETSRSVQGASCCQSGDRLFSWLS